jgi:hypothetical protein
MDTIEPVPVIIIEGILIFYFPEIRVKKNIEFVYVRINFVFSLEFISNEIIC